MAFKMSNTWNWNWDDDDGYYDGYYDHYDGFDNYGRFKYKPLAIWDEDAVLNIHTSWDSEQAKKERTIFGNKEEGLFYNYSDRLYEWDYKKTTSAYEYAALVAKPKTAKFYSAMLSYFHDGAEVSLRHIIAGCNRSNGYSYLVFGYKYESKPAEDAVRLAQYEEIRLGKVKTIKHFTEKFEVEIKTILQNLENKEPN
jgi:hypothetical protein